MQQRAVQTREAILAAAMDEFSQKGFHGARIDAVAAKAKVNKQRIYANFKSKAGLFAEVLKVCFLEMVKEEEELLELTPSDIPELPRRILECYAGIHDRHPELWRLLAWENLEMGRHASVLEGLQEPVIRHLASLYGQGQVEGHFPADVPFEGLLFNLMAVSYFMASNRHTLKQSIGLDLSNSSARASLIEAVARMLSHDGASSKQSAAKSGETRYDAVNT